MIVFLQLAIFWLVMRLSEDFTVRASICLRDEKHHKENDNSETCESILQNGHFLRRNSVK